MTQPRDSREVLNWAGVFLAISQVSILGMLGAALVFVEIPKSNESMLFALVGGVLAIVTNVNGFFFGSSHQQKKQSETIDTLSKAAATQGPQITASPGDTVRTESSTQTETRID